GSRAPRCPCGGSPRPRSRAGRPGARPGTRSERASRRPRALVHGGRRTRSSCDDVRVWAAVRRAASAEVGRPSGALGRRTAPPLLAALVVLSAVAYGLTTGSVRNIWILPDELTYGSLARSLAATGHFAIRGVDTLAYPIGYPLLISPAFRAHDPVTQYD